jgi:flagellin-like protein
MRGSSRLGALTGGDGSNVGDDRAVSPVIGVILMVAITVILAAVIGVFVLNYGNELQQSPPSASFTFDFEPNGDYTVTATHNGGDTFTSTNTGELRLVSSDDRESTFTPPTSASDSQEITDVGAGEDVRVIWESPDGSQSSIVAQTTTPPS